MSITKEELRTQWINPGDILSLLLLVGGDIVQKAIAQLVGWRLRPYRGCQYDIGLTPVAFSFGWVAYAFIVLVSAVGENQLMPPSDQFSIVVNCENAFPRSNQSWILGRLLRDYEARHKVDPSDPGETQARNNESTRVADSIRIDIFELGVHTKPIVDMVWWLGWLTMIVQVAIALVPWIIHGDWGPMMIVLCGNSLALLTCALPQWNDEKWAGRKLRSDKVMALTRGNGHYHIMILIGQKGSWDIETLATATRASRPETSIASLILAALWTCLLISVSGLKNNTWYLVGVGSLGMLQNIYAAGKERDPDAYGFDLTEYSPMPTIIGKRRPMRDDDDSTVSLDRAMSDVSPLSDWLRENDDSKPPEWLDSMDGNHGMPVWLTPLSNRPAGKEQIENVHGALMELERWVPTAGLAMLQTFFPTALSYKDESIRNNIHKKFWKRAYHVEKIRRKAEEKKRLIRRKQQTASQVKQAVKDLP
jgi:hypothetical protein